MKIEEVIDLYDFLSNCGPVGYFGIWLALTVLLCAAAIWGKEKLSVDQNTSRLKIFGIIGMLNVIVILMFYLEASRRQRILRNANCIKSEFITYGWKVASYSTMMDSSFHCTCDSLIIKEILDNHPTEFIKVKTDDREEDGMRIIDEDALTAINTYNHEHSPFIKSRILDYMNMNHVDIISYSDIRSKINPDFDDEWLEIMLSKYDTLFTPFNTLDETLKYGETHFIKRVDRRPGIDLLRTASK